MDDIESMSKDDLIAYAELHGIEIDKRWSAARIREALAAPSAAMEATDTDLVTFSPPVIEMPPAGTFNLDSAVSIWAEGFANQLDRAWAEFHGSVFRVSLKTWHGLTVVDIEGVDDSEASIMAALDKAREMMIAGDE